MKLSAKVVEAALKASAAHRDMLLVEAEMSLAMHRGESLTLRQRSDLNLARIQAGQLREAFVNAVLREGLSNG